MYCENCGSKIVPGTEFCVRCGTKLDGSGDKHSDRTNSSELTHPETTPSIGYDQSEVFTRSTYQPSKYSTRQPNKVTTRLRIVIILHWIGFVVLGFIGLLSFFIFFLLGLFLLLIAWLQYWIARQLEVYNPSARITVIILSFIELIIIIFNFNFFSMLITLFILYVMILDAEVVNNFSLQW